MTAKKYFQQLWWLDREIDEKIKELGYLRARAEGCSAPEITGMPKGQAEHDRVADQVAKLVDLQKYINDQWDKLIDLQTMITKQICELEDQKSRIILSCRYLRHQKWEDIGRELHYDKSTIMRIHKEALHRFERQHPEIRSM